MIPSSGHVECGLDRLIQLGDLVGVARPHESFQAVSGIRQEVVQIGDAADRQSLASAQRHFSGKLSDRSRYQGNDDPTNAVENGVACQDHDWPATDGRRQLAAPDLPTLHALSAFQTGTSGSSPNTAACVSATSDGSTSVMATASRYCRTASSTRADTSRPWLAATSRNCSSMPLGSSMLTGSNVLRAVRSFNREWAVRPNQPLEPTAGGSRFVDSKLSSARRGSAARR